MSILSKLKLTSDDDAPAAQKPVIQPQVTVASAYVPPNYSYAAQPTIAAAVAIGLVDPDMVAKIKTAVLGSSPIISKFMQNVERMKAAFPDDAPAQMKAAIAFTEVDKGTLSEELNRTVAAALLHTKSNLEAEHGKAHDAIIGPLQQQLATATNDIGVLQNQITQLQQNVATKQQNAEGLQSQIKAAEANLQQQDNVVKSSFGQVEQYIATLGQTFTKI